MSFTAAVSHELRTPLARILALLDSATLPGADVQELVEQARMEIEQAGELIDEILFLSELETGAEVVALGTTPAAPIVDEILDGLADAAARARALQTSRRTGQRRGRGGGRQRAGSAEGPALPRGAARSAHTRAGGAR